MLIVSRIPTKTEVGMEVGRRFNWRKVCIVRAHHLKEGVDASSPSRLLRESKTVGKAGNRGGGIKENA